MCQADTCQAAELSKRVDTLLSKISQEKEGGEEHHHSSTTRKSVKPEPEEASREHKRNDHATPHVKHTSSHTKDVAPNVKPSTPHVKQERHEDRVVDDRKKKEGHYDKTLCRQILRGVQSKLDELKDMQTNKMDNKTMIEKTRNVSLQRHLQ